MWDASDYSVGAVVGQHQNKFFYAIYYASKFLNENQVNYATIENELLAVVFALNFFCSYLIGSKFIVFILLNVVKIVETLVWSWKKIGMLEE